MTVEDNHSTRVTNKDIKDLLLNRWEQTDSNTTRLNVIEPRIDSLGKAVKTHDIILRGDPDSINDGGLVGSYREMKKFFDTLSSWVKPIALSIIGWLILTAVQKALEVMSAVDLLTH